MEALYLPQKAFLRRLILACACLSFSAVAVDLDPVFRGRWPLFPRGPASAVAVQNGYAYVAAQLGGLAIFDVSNPTNPRRVGGCCDGSYTIGVAVLGNFVYLIDPSRGLSVIDV